MWPPLLGSDGTIRIRPLTHLLTFLLTFSQVFPVGFGQGTYGLNGIGFQFLITLFVLLFGISLGQLIAAISPSVQVSVSVVVVGFTMSFVRLLCSSTPLWGGFWALIVV